MPEKAIQEAVGAVSAGGLNKFVVGGMAVIGVALVATVLAIVHPSNGTHHAVIIDNRLAPASMTSGRPAVPDFTTYINDRFGFRIGCPRAFIASDSSANSDGITLVSPDGAATLVVAGGNNDGLTTRQYYDSFVGSISGELGYKRLEHRWFVVTWRDGNRIGYRKMFVGSGSQNSFTFTFPESQRSIYEPVVTRIEKSFKPGAMDQSH